MLTRMEESVEAFDEPVKDNDDERLYSEFVEQHDEVNVEQMELYSEFVEALMKKRGRRMLIWVQVAKRMRTDQLLCIT